MTSMTPPRRLQAPWWLASAALLVVLALGFAPGYGRHLTQHRLAIHVHTAVLMAWVLLLIVQRALLAAGMRRGHRWLGWTGIAVGCAVMASGLAVLRDLAGRGPLTVARVHDVLLAASGLGLFALALLWALLARCDRAIHGRAMAWTGMALAWAGLHRAVLSVLPGLDEPRWAAVGSGWMLFCLGGLLWLEDAAAQRPAGRVHAAGCLALLGALAVLAWAPTSPLAWTLVASWVTM
jgi:hypothetical protein